MAAAAHVVLVVVALVLPSRVHFVGAHRGDDEVASVPLSFETLPRATFHYEGQRRKVGDVQNHVTPASFLEEGFTSLVTQEAKNASVAAPPGGLEITITQLPELPMTRFVGVPHEADHDPGHVATIKVRQVPPTVVAQAHADTPHQHTDLKSRKKQRQEFEGKFDDMPLSVIRIQAITAEVNWFEPYEQPQDVQLVGSGVAIDLEGVPNKDKDPIFITNAHVVRDAHDVQVQLPALGQQFFEAFVPLICDDFDLAVVQLVEPAKFLDALKKSGFKDSMGRLKTELQAFKIQPRHWKLGEEVASVGFPLGSTSLKLSRGVISGTEEVGDFICYQTTAPISPGSSGGPLFGLDDGDSLQVVGATFASAASRGAQNTNYVVPTIAITQVLEEYREERRKNDAQKKLALEEEALEAAGSVNRVAEDGRERKADNSAGEQHEAEQHPGEGHSGEHGEHKDERVVLQGPHFAGEGSLPAAATRQKHLEAPQVKGKKKEGCDDDEPVANVSAITFGRKAKLGHGIDAKSAREDHRHHASLGVRRLKKRHNNKLTPRGLTLHPHKQYRIAPVDAVGIEGNQALYDYTGCRNGVYLSKILDTSAFKKASFNKNDERTEIPEGSFLTQVMGPDNTFVPLDSFGMGRSTAFLGDPTPFESIMMMKAKPGETVKVMICEKGGNGNEVEYKVNMSWDDGLYEQPVKLIMEPHFHADALRYEVFAGVTVMQMTVNHIIKLLRIGQPPTLGRWLLPENQRNGRLIITHVEKGAYASRVLAPGMVVAKVNNQPVTDIDSYVDAFQEMEGDDKNKVWTLETDRGVFFATKFVDSLIQQIMKIEMGLSFLSCESVLIAARDLQHHMPKNVGHSLKNASVSSANQPKVVARAFQQDTPIAGAWDGADPNSLDIGDRVTRLAKVHALTRSSSIFLEMGRQNNTLDEKQRLELRRRVRLAHAGFRTIPAAEYIADRDLREVFGAPAATE